MTWKALALAAVATLAVVCGVNLLAWTYLKIYPVNVGLSRVWQKWQLIDRQTAPVDWLVLGDSTCWQGIVPSAIEQATGETGLNLCTIANATVFNGVWQLEYYIDRVGAPKRAIFFLAFHVRERRKDDLVSLFDQIPLVSGFYRRLSLPLELDFLGNLEVATRPVRTLFISNLSIQFILGRELRSLLTGSKFERSDAISDMGFVVRNQGYVPSSKANPKRVITQFEASARAYAQRNFFISPDDQAALRSVGALATEHNFPIYLANSSICRPLY